jgi:virulence-associated protein VagC
MFTMRVFNLLRLIGVPAARAEAELKEMDNVEIRKSENRRVLGSMNEIALTLQLMAEDASAGPLKVSEGEMQIAKSIFTFTKYVPPAELARAILCAASRQVN